jgi:hypothetical protein
MGAIFYARRVLCRGNGFDQLQSDYLRFQVGRWHRCGARGAKTMTATYYGRTWKGLKGPYKDRHGKVRCQYRPTGRYLPIPETVSFRVFDRAYWDAVGAVAKPSTPKPRPLASPDGTVEKAVRVYIDWLHAEFKAEPSRCPEDTYKSRKSLLGVWARTPGVGENPLSLFRKEHVEAGLENRKDTPTTAKNWFYAVRKLFQWCKENKRFGVTADPTQGVTLAPLPETPGLKAWTEKDVAKFIKQWPAGTMEHRALMILLTFGQRRYDVVELGWHKLEGDFLVFKQHKGGQPMRLPIPRDVLAVLPPRPAENVAELHPLPFLLTKTEGKPFTRHYFTNWFREACITAGLKPGKDGKGYGPHGLRKLAARRFYRRALDAGHPAPLQITMAFTGHTDEKTLRIYLGKGFEAEKYAPEMVAFMGGAA